MTVRALKVARIGGVFVLVFHFRKFAGESLEMGQIHDHQMTCHLGAPTGKTPRDTTTPIVADDNCAFLPLVADYRSHIFDEYLHVIVFDAGRFVA